MDAVFWRPRERPDADAFGVALLGLYVCERADHAAYPAAGGFRRRHADHFRAMICLPPARAK